MAEDKGQGNGDATPSPEELKTILDAAGTGDTPPPKDKEGADQSFEIDTPKGKQTLTLEELRQAAQSYHHLQPEFTRSRQELSQLKSDFEAMKAAPVSQPPPTETTEPDSLYDQYGEIDDAAVKQLAKRVGTIEKAEQTRQQQQAQREMMEWSMNTNKAVEEAISTDEYGKELEGDVKEALRKAIFTSYVERLQNKEQVSVEDVSSRFISALKKRDQELFDKGLDKLRKKAAEGRVEGKGGAALPEGKKPEESSWDDIKEMTKQFIKSSG